jgi:hypothetical protein
VGSGLCDELITRSEEPYRVCVCLNVFGLCLGPSRAVAAQRKNILVTNLFASNRSINSSTNSLMLVIMNYCVIDDNVSFSLIMNQNFCMADKKNHPR